MTVGTHKKIVNLNFVKLEGSCIFTLNDRIEHFKAYIRNQEAKLYQENTLVENIFFGRKWFTP